ncbi:MAG: DUF805 domain-containing protein [Rickettsiales bacterium]
MGFVAAIKHCFKNYATFCGRASRSEFWYFFLFNLIVAMITNIIDHALFMPHDAPPDEFGVFGSIVMLGFFLPALSVMVRRLHDVNKSGWWVLLVFIPLVGLVLFIVWGCLKGTEGENRFGAVLTTKN